MTSPCRSQNPRFFDLVLFDLGQTLIYFDDNWPDVIQESNLEMVRALHEAGFAIDPEPFSAEYSQRIGVYYSERNTSFVEYTAARVLYDLLHEHGFGDPPMDTVQRAIDALHAVEQRYWKLEPDAHETLARLEAAGYCLGMISNASDEHDVQTLVNKHGLRKYFRHVLVSAALGIRKPHPEIFKQALDYWQVPAERTVMIGDTLGADILGANQAGIASVWIARRADRPDNRAHLDTIRPDARIETLAELPDVLAKWGGKIV
jgi:HAD superfamily hydrolase (TIGR01662 family)